jgi:hypothetical protein
MVRLLALLGAAALAASPVVGAGVDCDLAASSSEPQGVHLAISGGDASTSVAVSFFSCSCDGSQGESSVEVTRVSDGSKSGVFFGSVVKTESRCHHDVLVTGLEPATDYQYTVSVDDSSPPSAAFTFSTMASSSSSSSFPFTAVVVGDMGINNTQQTVPTLLRNLGAYDLALHVGDVSYADDALVKIEPSSGLTYEGVYDEFQRLVEPIAAAVPYMVSPGNHDVSCRVTTDLGCPQHQKNFTAFRNRWRMPSVESGASEGEHHNVWYSFTVSNVHFVSISTESDFPHAPTTPNTKIGGGAGGGFGDQLAWLRKDLAAANDDPRVKFVVALGHRPWLSSSLTDWPLLAPRHVRSAFEPLFEEFGVDMYVAGHKHYYERCGEVKGTVQIVNGAAGNNEGVQGAGKGSKDGIVASNYEDTGFGELAGGGEDGVLRWRYVLSGTGEVYDEVVLKSRR